ncbi:MAG: hypothetical protein KatS3mg053_1033 [Candidatus Roseilinea sp.]|nr:MAG: hypothetical protein KatS3mg053_1033 [Candidatus Roseilinea sp.]
MNPTDRRFIEETFPVKEVSAQSAKEKSIRHGHISTLHIWWARRPLAASRATAYAALIPAASEDVERWQRQRDFIALLSRWENSLNAPLLERARRETYAAHAARLSAELGRPVTVEDILAGRCPPPRVLDPFSGGGSYPLEALRLGCEAYANDYNPVAVLILKATLEYPQRFGRPFPGMPEHLRPRKQRAAPASGQLSIEMGETARPDAFNPLLEAVKFWGAWVLEEARKELAPFYPAGLNQDVTTEEEAERWHVPEALRRKMVAVARDFRKNPTPSEAILWQALRGKQLDGVKFRRQQPIGPFVVDFFASSHRLIVEVDGPIHETQKAADEARQRLLESLGLRFVRLPADLVERDLPAALERIREALRPHPQPLPHEGGGVHPPSPLVGEGG